MTANKNPKPDKNKHERPDKMSEDSLTGPQEDVGGGGVAGNSMTETRGTGGGPSIPEPVSKDMGKR